jgi:hypothetical protein
MRRLALTLLCVLLAAALCTAQQLSKKMTNKDVIEMQGLGLPDDVIIEKIQTASATDFDTSVAGLKALKAAKVSNDVIRAMVHQHPATAGGGETAPIETAPAEAAPPETAPAASLSPPPFDKRGLPKEVGVYVILKGRLAEVDPELVGWQSGGALKHVATLGLDKGHVNGKVMNAKSPLQLARPVIFIIKTPEGTSATEYQLLQLDEKENRREFRATTGGVIHSSGGAERNALSFAPEKVGDRVWRIVLKGVAKGEYGFLPPGVSSASLSASGKMYTFGVIE